MLKSISLANFKSYREATLHLAPLTSLIGANASGKSNALEAIRLLNWLAKGSRLDDIERGVQGGNTVVRGQAMDFFRETSDSFSHHFSLGCFFSGPTGATFRFAISIGPVQGQTVVVGETIEYEDNREFLYKTSNDARYTPDIIDITYNASFSRINGIPQVQCSGKQAVFFQLKSPVRLESIFYQANPLIIPTAQALREDLRNVVFLDPRPSPMRGYAYSKDDTLKEDGSNLSAVLYRLCQQGEQTKSQLLQFIRSLPEQDNTDIQFIVTERKDVMVRLEESFGDQKRIVDAPLLSDGTLRVLAVGAALLSAPEGALVIIEEIDNGVHPSRADVLVNQIQAVAKERNLRVLVTSHNPALLDALPDEALGDVMCCYRDPKEGDSRLVRLGDFDRFPELIAQGPLGQLMTRRVLDRFLKDDRTPEQRRQANLEWLKRFKESSENP